MPINLRSRQMINSADAAATTAERDALIKASSETMNSRHFEQILSLLVVGMILVNGGNVWLALVVYMVINIVIAVRSWLPELVPVIKKWVENYAQSHNEGTGLFGVSRHSFNSSVAGGVSSDSADLGNIDKRSDNDRGDGKIQAIIRFERNRETGSDDVTIQAMMHYMSSISTCQKVVYNQQYYVVNKEEFQLRPGYYCRVTNYEQNNNGSIERYCFEVYSYRYNINELHEFIRRVVQEYNAEQASKLGKNIYFFNEEHQDVPIGPDGQPRLERAPQHMSFTKSVFKTNKSLDTLYGRHLDSAKRQIYRFIRDPQWYEKKGRPHTLGIMLYGPPGSGKTAFTKAIAKATKCHLFNIKLRSTTTQKQLTRLFFEEDVHITDETGAKYTAKIPLDRRIYVIEDIDSLTDVVLDRRIQQERMLERIRKRDGINSAIQQTKSGAANACDFAGSTPVGGQNVPVGVPQGLSAGLSKQEQIALERMMGEEQDKHPDALNLSFLLNLLDGILETPGRILIVTTNHRDQLDPALIRPGRIDLDIEVGYCDIQMIQDMVNGFFEHHVELPAEFHQEYTHTITPAVMNAILLDSDAGDTDPVASEEHAMKDLLRVMRKHNKQKEDAIAAQRAADEAAAEWMRKQEEQMAAWQGMMMGQQQQSQVLEDNTGTPNTEAMTSGSCAGISVPVPDEDHYSRADTEHLDMQSQQTAASTATSETVAVDDGMSDMMRAALAEDNVVTEESVTMNDALFDE